MTGRVGALGADPKRRVFPRPARVAQPVPAELGQGARVHCVLHVPARELLEYKL